MSPFTPYHLTGMLSWTIEEEMDRYHPSPLLCYHDERNQLAIVGIHHHRDEHEYEDINYLEMSFDSGL